MTLSIRPGDLDVDEPGVIGLLARYLNPDYDKARFDWLYRTNPAGRGRLWVAMDEQRGEIIGCAGAFPRVMYVKARETTAWVLGDFCVAEAYRALGPALMLQRACLKALAAEAAAVWYDFPAAGMMPVYRRLGHEPAAKLSRQVRLLRVDARLAALVPSPVLSRGLAWVGNRILAAGMRSYGAPRDLSISVHDGAVGPEFSGLSARVAPEYDLCLARPAAYLTWRYRENPTRHCEIVTVRRGQELLAYAVVGRDGEQASLLDLFGIGEPPAIAALLGETLSRLRDQRCQTVVCALIDSHPWMPILTRLGFVERGSAPVMRSALPPASLVAPGPAGMAWFLIDGDRDG